MNRRAFDQLNGLLARFVSWASSVRSIPAISLSASDSIWPLQIHLPVFVDFMTDSLSDLLVLPMT